jgi:hypothetical protein
MENKIVNNFHLLNKETKEKVSKKVNEWWGSPGEINSAETRGLCFDLIPLIKIDCLEGLLKIALARSGGDINTRVISVGDLQYAIRVQDGTEERISTEGV